MFYKFVDIISITWVCLYSAKLGLFEKNQLKLLKVMPLLILIDNKDHDTNDADNITNGVEHERVCFK